MCMEVNPSDFCTNSSNHGAVNYFCGNRISSLYKFQMGRDSCHTDYIISLDTGGWKGKTETNMQNMSTVMTTLGRKM